MVLVASYNMRKAIGTDRRRRPERTLAVLGEFRPDIVALQECDRRFGERVSVIAPEAILEHTPWKPVVLGHRPGSLGWHGNAILVPKEAEVTEAVALDLPMIEPRGAVLVEIVLREQPIRVIGMHLDLSGLYRRRQARAILAEIASRPAMPTVMMGDLNEWSRNRGCLRDFSDRHIILETGASFHARQPMARLDRIIVSRNVEASAAGVHHSALARIASDHLPIWAKLAIR